MTADEQLTPEARRIVPALRQQQTIERRSRALTVGIVASVAIVLAGLVWLFAHTSAADEVGRAKDATHDQEITGLQDQMKGVCRKVVSSAQLTPAERDGCYRAENSIPPEPSTVTAAPAQTGISAGQVQAMIAAAVAQVPRPLTIDQVTATAQMVYAANKPLEATPERIADAVASFCSGDTCKGPPGVQGPSGAAAPPLTDEQIRAQVATYCAANNGCVGPPGAPGAAGPAGAAGPQGVSVQSFGNPETAPDDATSCRVPVHLFDPKDDSQLTIYFSVPLAFCLP